MLGVENVPPARRELPCDVVKGVKSPRKVVGKCTWVCHARFPSLPFPPSLGMRPLSASAAFCF